MWHWASFLSGMDSHCFCCCQNFPLSKFPKASGELKTVPTRRTGHGVSYREVVESHRKMICKTEEDW